MWTESPSMRGSEFSLVGFVQSDSPRYIDFILPTLAVQIAYILTVTPFPMLSEWIFYCLLNSLEAWLQLHFSILLSVIKGFI